MPALTWFSHLQAACLCSMRTSLCQLLILFNPCAGQIALYDTGMSAQKGSREKPGGSKGLLPPEEPSPMRPTWVRFPWRIASANNQGP